MHVIPTWFGGTIYSSDHYQMKRHHHHPPRYVVRINSLQLARVVVYLGVDGKDRIFGLVPICIRLMDIEVTNLIYIYRRFLANGKSCCQCQMTNTQHCRDNMLLIESEG